MAAIRIRVVCPYWHFPEVNVEPEHLQEAVERLAYDENLPPKCSIYIYPDFLYENASMETPAFVLPIDERLRSFLAFQPSLGPSFINKVAEWIRQKEDEPSIEENAGENEIFFY